MDEAERWKVEGNELFRKGDLDGAAACYSRAISAGGPSAHVYFANRAACHAGASNWASARDDATRCVELCPSYVKGHYRLAQALIALGKRDEAAAAAKAGLEYDKSNTEMLRLLRKAEEDSGIGGRPKGKSKLGIVGLYDDMPAAAPATSVVSDTTGGSGASSSSAANDARAIFRRLRDSVAGGGAPATVAAATAPDPAAAAMAAGGAHVLDGVFARLLQPVAFQETVFPGLSEEQRKSAPQSFQALLADAAYAAELEAAVPRAMERACSVL
ncbi:unnamed protein product, partial [Phaeothamnion confervicola]